MDGKTLERAIVSTKVVSNRRVRIDIAAIKELIKQGEVERVKWIDGKGQIADCLMNIGRKEKLLLAYIMKM